MGLGGRLFAKAIVCSLAVLTDGRAALAAGPSLLDPTPPRSPTLTVGLAGFAQNLFKSVSVSDAASTSFLSTVFPALVVGTSVPVQLLSGSDAARFQLGFSPLGSSTSDGGVSRRVLWASALFAHEFSDFSVHGGICTWLTLYSSSRGTVTLNNGGATDHYYIPSAGETTRLFAWQLGAVLPLGSWLDFQGDLIVGAPLSSTRRTFAAVLSLQVPLWLQ